MENYLPLLQTTSLFEGICAEALAPLLRDLGAVVRSYGTVSYTHLTLPTNREV